MVSRANHVAGLEPSVLPLTGMEVTHKDATINTPEDGAWGSFWRGHRDSGTCRGGSPSPTSPVPELYPYRNRRSVSHASKLIEPEGGVLRTSHPPGDTLDQCLEGVGVTWGFWVGVRGVEFLDIPTCWFGKSPFPTHLGPRASVDVNHLVYKYGSGGLV